MQVLFVNVLTKDLEWSQKIDPALLGSENFSNRLSEKAENDRDAVDGIVLEKSLIEEDFKIFPCVIVKEKDYIPRHQEILKELGFPFDITAQMTYYQDIFYLLVAHEPEILMLATKGAFPELKRVNDFLARLFIECGVNAYFEKVSIQQDSIQDYFGPYLEAKGWEALETIMINDKVTVTSKKIPKSQVAVLDEIKRIANDFDMVVTDKVFYKLGETIQCLAFLKDSKIGLKTSDQDFNIENIRQAFLLLKDMFPAGFFNTKENVIIRGSSQVQDQFLTHVREKYKRFVDRIKKLDADINLHKDRDQYYAAISSESDPSKKLQLSFDCLTSKLVHKCDARGLCYHVVCFFYQILGEEPGLFTNIIRCLDQF